MTKLDNYDDDAADDDDESYNSQRSDILWRFACGGVFFIFIWGGKYGEQRSALNYELSAKLNMKALY